LAPNPSLVGEASSIHPNSPGHCAAARRLLFEGLAPNPSLVGEASSIHPNSPGHCAAARRLLARLTE